RHMVSPGTACLRCLKQFDPGLVAAEQRGDLADSSYIESLPAEHPLRSNENVFAFSTSLAAAEVLEFIRLVIAPGGLGVSSPKTYHLVTDRTDDGPDSCEPGCLYSTYIALGEKAGHSGTSFHKEAEDARDVTRGSLSAASEGYSCPT